MSLKIFLILFISSFFFGILNSKENFNSTSKKYSNQPTKLELVVVFENYNGKFKDEVISQINQMNGLKLLGYCETLNCFYMEVDATVYKSSEDAFHLIETKMKKYLPVYKEGTTSNMVITNCPRF